MIKAGELLARVDVLQRGLDAQSQLNVQRELSSPRMAEISAFSKEPDAAFPTSIIVSSYSEHVRPAEDGRSLLVGRFPRAAEVAEGTPTADPLNDIVESPAGEVDGAPVEPEPLQTNETFGQVIDGQHRLAGLRNAGAENPESPLYRFELPVVFMVGLDDHDRAYIFSTINSKQTKVSSSLIYDLFGLLRHRSPKRTCHDVAAALNAKEGGPFYRSLKMLGKKTHPTESLTQGSFAAYLLPHLSRDPTDDESRIKAGKELMPDDRCIFRKYFLQDRDEFIVAALDGYFQAIKDLYPNAWADPQHYALRRTVGFAALMRVLPDVWKSTIVPAGKINTGLFADAVRPFGDRVLEEHLRDIRSSGGAAVRLANQLLGVA